MKPSYLDKMLEDMRLKQAIALGEEGSPPGERPVQYVSVKEAASLLQVGQRTLRRLIKNGELPAYWVRGHNILRIRWSDIYHMLERASVSPPRRKRKSRKKTKMEVENDNNRCFRESAPKPPQHGD